MDHTQQSLWGKAIATGDDGVTIERPPTSLYRFWTGSQEEVTQDSRRSLTYQEKLKTRTDKEETKDFMSKFIRFNEQQMKMRLAETMTDQMERMASRQRPPPPSSPPSPPSSPSPPQLPPQQWQPPPVNSSYPAYQPASYSQWQQPVSWQEAPPSPSSLISSLSFASSSRPSRSSPIEPPEEEKAVIEQFFLWKIARTTRQAVKNKIAEVRRLVDNQMWSINDLKEMSDTTSSIYRTAIQLGVPDGMTKSFRDDLKIFKPQWRQAKDLLHIEQA